MAFRIALPLPPSSNNAYANAPGKGRVATAKLKQWRHDAGWLIQIARPDPIRCRYTLTLTVARTMRGDVSNRIKHAEDLLVAHRLTPDDSRADAVAVKRSDAVAEGEMLIEAAAA